ncbi:MAG: SprB repeat-containing protein [Chitinophagales bacterium]|nr:SprB repeat-containing protein [Chitinophagales bacterium]
MKKIIMISAACFLTAHVFADDIEATVTTAAYGENNGTITLSITAGVAPYSIVWTGPDGFTSTEEDITNLVPGEYCVLVNDFYCGTAELCVTVEEEPYVSIDHITSDNIQVYPNPFSCQLRISMHTGRADEYVFHFSDDTGKEIYSEKHYLPAGENNLQINVPETHVSGNLVLRITDNGDKAITKQILHIK